MLCEYEQHQSTSDIAFKENLTIRLENAVQALQNLSPFVSDANREAVLEMTRNFQLMFWNCYRRCEFPSRTRCSQVAVLWLSSQGVLSNDFVINCLHFQESRDLETSGNRVYQMLQTFLRNLSLDGLKDFLKFVTRTWEVSMSNLPHRISVSCHSGDSILHQHVYLNWSCQTIFRIILPLI